MGNHHPISIPQPRRAPLLGHLPLLRGATPVQNMIALARSQGPIFQIDVPGRTMTIISSQALVSEACDEQRFDKYISAPLQNVRPFAGDGLFTAHTQEPNWHKAHNILLPNFSMRAMQGYMPAMLDIAEQLVAKWGRLNPDDSIDVAEDMTRLTLDTIGLCGFDYRFNSFYRETPHSFIQAMGRSLAEAMHKLQRLPIQEALMFAAHQQFGQDVAEMNQLVDTIIRERKAAGDTGKRDLLSYMLSGVDRQSGTGLDDVNIRYQIITFLIAGHETTSGLLSFALYFLLKHPEVLARAYADVDRVLGGPENTPSYAQVQQLDYIQQILKEALRLWPTAPVFTLYPYADTTLGGRYELTAGTPLTVLIPMLHRDPTVWGADAEQFRPERFADNAEQRLPPHAFKPFGNGQRACIGRQFAMQEAALVLGMILQRFELIDHTNYQLTVKETLTIKPDGFTLRVRPRRERAAALVTPLTSAVAHASSDTLRAAGAPLLVLYGSNMGTAESVAGEIAADGSARGYTVSVAPLDEYAGQLPQAGAVVLVCSSYNGAPPDNAVRFVAWLREGAPSDAALHGVHYAVFGCGDHTWASSYQAVPTLLDESLAARGAQRLLARGTGDVADDFDGQFRAWYSGLWPALSDALGVTDTAPTAAGPIYSFEVVVGQAIAPAAAAYGARPLRVRVNRELLTAAAGRSTRHIELELPQELSYRTGDHLGILPRNDPALVRRVLVRFGRDGAQQVVIRRHAPGSTHLPLDRPVGLFELLQDYVEIQGPATRAQIAVLAEHTACPPEKIKLLALCGADAAGASAYREHILKRNVALLDLLERFRACELPFERFIELLSPLRPRYYSIASSPLTEPAAASLTVSVVAGPAYRGDGEYRGVASNYLADLPVGAYVPGFIRSPALPFRPPEQPATPLIMVGPGTGLAPFRGFLQERAAQRAMGQAVGPALLFFGCRRPDHDYLYAEELERYAADGIVRVLPAFSRQPGAPKVYVQQQIAANADAVWELLEGGAPIYVCGDAAHMAPAVRATFAELFCAKTGADALAAEAWLRDLEVNQRYLADVWA